jgi:hypothetical protein
LVFLGPLGTSLLDFLFRGLRVWVLQCKMLLGICTSVLPRFLFGQYNLTRNLILGHPGPISVFLCLLVCLPVCPESLGILSRYIQDDVKCRKLTVAVSVKIWITKIWGMVPAGIQVLIFACSRFTHGTFEIFLPFSNVKFLIFLGPLGASFFDFLFRGLAVWVFQ